MIYIIQIYIIIATLFLAGKDANSYRMKDKSGKDENLMLKRIKRWHRDGVVLNVMLIMPFVYYTENYWIALYAILIRVSLFDVAFNKWAGLPVKYLGSTAWFDQQFIKAFGKNGAIKKSAIFFAILIIMNVIIK